MIDFDKGYFPILSKYLTINFLVKSSKLENLSLPPLPSTFTELLSKSISFRFKLVISSSLSPDVKKSIIIALSRIFKKLSFLDSSILFKTS